MTFCGNIVELLEKRKVLEDGDFIHWIDTNIKEELNIEVYIENKIIPELKKKDLVLIDVAIGEVNGKKVGMLFLKKDSDVYG